MSTPDLPVQNDALSEDARTRLLMHGIHEETIFYNRLNFFLLIEALLLSAVITAYGSGRQAPMLMFQAAAAVGALTSMIWLIVQLDKMHLVNTLVARIEKVAPEFDETIKQNEDSSLMNVAATRLLAWAIPALFLGMWLVLLAMMLFGSN